MDTPRRLFLTQASLIAGALLLKKQISAATLKSAHIYKPLQGDDGITFFHTNNLDGSIGPVYKNFGGLFQIKKQLEEEQAKGLLFDAGGFLNNTGNIGKQKDLIGIMNATGYSAAALSSHELSIGPDQLATLIPLMQFPLINCNHRFDNQFNKLVKPYAVINTGKIRIGVTAVCPRLKGFEYYDPISSANRTALLLKRDEKCELIICLSQLSVAQQGDQPDNLKLAAASENIDIIMGGDNYKLHAKTLVMSNKLKHEVILTQAAAKGLTIGKTLVSFDDKKKKKNFDAKYLIPGAPGNQPFATALENLKPAKDLYLSV